MNRGSRFIGKEQRTKQKGLLHRKDISKKPINGKEGKQGKRANRNEKLLKLNISQAIDEALNDLKNQQEYDAYESELIPPSPIQPVPIADKEPISPIKEKQRRSSFDVTHVKSPILAPTVSEVVIEPLSLSSPVHVEIETKHPTGLFMFIFVICRGGIRR